MDADLIYVPLTAQWASCDYHEDINAKIEDFTANLHIYLPLLSEKPHFMALSRVFRWTHLDMEVYKAAGITFITVEGDLTHSYVTVPYPGLYHHHSGLHANRFMRNAMVNKTFLAYESFGMHGHVGDALAFREALYKVCISHPENCQHSMPDYTGEHASSNALQFFTNASSAWFCLQPSGDSPTRRSTFDCLLAGSIPVFFDNTSITHFPWSDMIAPQELVVLHAGEVQQLLNVSLLAISVADRQKRLNRIADVAHLYQYSLTPRSGLIRWDNIHDICHWDDAFTFGLKALIRNLQTHERLLTSTNFNEV